MILSELGAIPDDGTTAEIEAFGLQMKITRIIEHRIDEVIVCKIEPSGNDDE
jgi:CBS domain containing-hemolysin-like protein